MGNKDSRYLSSVIHLTYTPNNNSILKRLLLLNSYSELELSVRN